MELMAFAKNLYGQQDRHKDHRRQYAPSIQLVFDRTSSICSNRHLGAQETVVMHGWAIVENGVPLQAVSLPTPEPRGAQVLLQVTHCGVCHSDLYFQDGYYDLGGGKRLSLEARGVSLPFVPGHETVGKVVAFGPDASNVAVGDERIVFHCTGCGPCNRSKAHSEHLY